MAEDWENTISDDAVARAVEYTLNHGGGTFAVPSLFPMHPTRGFAIGIPGDLPVTEDLLGRAIGFTARRITGRCCVSTWFDANAGLWIVEQSRLVTNYAEAYRLGIENRQDAIWDFKASLAIVLPKHVRGAVA